MKTKNFAGFDLSCFVLCLCCFLSATAAAADTASMPATFAASSNSSVAATSSETLRTLARCWIKAIVARVDATAPLDAQCIRLLRPSIMSIYPSTPVSGEEVKLSGSNLKNGILFVAGKLVRPTYRNDNELRFVAPAHARGTYPLRLKSVAGDATLIVQYAEELRADPALGTDALSISGSSCIVTPAHTVKCWGDNQSGQLGNGTTESTEIPTTVEGITDAIAIGTAPGYSCALLASGGVDCWGMPGVLGTGSYEFSYTPVPVLGITDATELSVGEGNSCAVLASGGVWCWGYNGSGQLGNGSTTDSLAPVEVQGIDNAVDVATQNAKSCAVLSDGTAACWGALGTENYLRVCEEVDDDVFWCWNEQRPFNSSLPLAVDTTDAIDITVSSYQALALQSSGRVQQWGDFDREEPNETTGAADLVPRDLGATDVASLGDDCLVFKDGTVGFCVQNYYAGRYLSDPYAGHELAGITDAVAVSAAGYGLCALRENGSLQCFDRDSWDLKKHAAPVIVALPARVKSVSANYQHACAVTDPGTAYCWGANAVGQVGNNSSSFSAVPVSIGVTDAVSVSVGLQHGCALQATGTVMCWGQYSGLRIEPGECDEWGSCSDYSYYPRSMVPLPVGVSGAVAITAQEGKTCALLESGQVQCWGFSQEYAGQEYEFLRTQEGISSATSIGMGTYHTCVTELDGTVKCWGDNSQGQLGVEGAPPSAIPVTVSGIASAVSVVAGSAFSCALLADHSVGCWGSNRDGQLGHADTAMSATAVAVAGIDDAVAVSAGFNHACALLADGAVRCWGDNHDGEIGNAAFGRSTAPAFVTGFDGSGAKATAIMAGGNNSCAILQSGRLACWGDNEFSQLAQPNWLLTKRVITDFDVDGVRDDEDNCRWLTNADQADANGDGIGDLCATL